MTSYQVEYAKSGRSKCKLCKDAVPSGAVRIGKLMDVGDYKQVVWHHLDCMLGNRTYKNLDPAEFKGFQDLSEDDRDHLRAEFAKSKETKIVRKRNNAEDSAAENDSPPPKKNAKKDQSLMDEAESAFNMAASGRKSKSAPRSKPRKGMTAEQHEQFLGLCEVYNGKKTEDLRGLLRQNHQKVSGNKKELVERCAEGKLLGALPLCTQCHRGYPRMDYRKKGYVCSGYMEHGTMVACDNLMQEEDIPRTEWQE